MPTKTLAELPTLAEVGDEQGHWECPEQGWPLMRLECPNGHVWRCVVVPWEANWPDVTCDECGEQPKRFRWGGFGGASKLAHVAFTERLPALAEVERAHAEKVLGLLKGNRTRSAKVLGISVRTLQMKLRKWGTESIAK